jgi:hypothetical protein
VSSPSRDRVSAIAAAGASEAGGEGFKALPCAGLVIVGTNICSEA